MHMLQHLVEDQLILFGPPKNFSCYLDENYIGVLKIICGHYPKTIETVAMAKIRLSAGVDAIRSMECTYLAPLPTNVGLLQRFVCLNVFGTNK